MSNTRHAENGSPLSQERYLSSPEYAELRGVSGVAVAQRAALLESTEDRELIWFLQSMSLKPGGLMAIAKSIAGIEVPDVSANTLERQRRRIEEQARIAEKIRYVRDGGEESKTPTTKALRSIKKRLDVDEVWAHLQDLCINPKLQLATDAVIGEIRKYKSQYEESVKSDFVLTSNGQQIWGAFDRVIKTRRIALVNGRQGIGKTEAAKAWCNSHLGEARFVSLKGITNRTNAFREIGKALGVASGPTRKTTEMQDRIEDVLQRSRLLLIVDEAHRAFKQSERVYKRPELLDWIVTLNNQSVPIALVTTPDFFVGIERVNAQIDWNWHQLSRRIRPYIELKPTPAAEIETVARKLVPYASKQMITFMLGYAKMARRDLSGLGDLVEEARLRCESAGRTKITFNDLDNAVTESLTPADAVFLNLEKRIEVVRKRGRRSAANAPADNPSMLNTRVISPAATNGSRLPAEMTE